MEDIRIEDENRRVVNDRVVNDDRSEYSASSTDDEVPFHIPRD